ncbi:hypothetical protein [Natrinema halophilum]|uniref:Uncharacterized protein n=1 Tax=Natrinema halophilum TaxID=1699371 RepID=A0A7D5L3E0_9EURY|nr:hypothetical protein [Natrinema halophilum]QLG49245.1 hypothetical protein HYG82_10440 [Natrinema halophilum]
MAIDLPPAVADDWQRVGRRTDDRTLSLATITTETAVFEHQPTADALERLRSVGDVPVRSLFTVDVRISPSLETIGLSAADALEVAAPNARDQFVDTIEDDEIAVRGERTSEHIDRPDGAVGHLSVLETAYPIDTTNTSDTVEAAGADASIDAEAHVAIWPADDAYVLAGGLLPLEGPDGADLLAAALDVDPARDREAIVDLFRGLDLGAPAGNGVSDGLE